MNKIDDVISDDKGAVFEDSKKLNLKRKIDVKDLDNHLKDIPLRVFVGKTTRRTISKFMKLPFHSIKTIGPSYLSGISFIPDFAERYQNMQDNITYIKAKIEYEKLNEAQAVRGVRSWK